MKLLHSLKILFPIFLLIFFSCKKADQELVPFANFSTLIIEFGEVTFRNKSFNATEYLWDFGDGNTSTEKDPIHSYLNIGNYNVTLTVSDGITSDDFTLLVVIGQVFPQNLTQLQVPPFGNIVEAFSFTYNGKGYVGGGVIQLPFFEISPDLWEFDPMTKEWTKIINDLPQNFRRSVGFVVDDNAYFGLGQVNNYDFYKYNFLTNALDFDSSLPAPASEQGSLNRAVAFVHNDIPYVIGKGQNGNFNPDPNNENKKMWKYDIQINQWSEVGDYPCKGHSGMYHFLLGDKLYIGMGLNLLNFNNTNDFWEYDVTNNIWTSKKDFPGLGRTDGLSFTFNGEGYFGFGQGRNINTGEQGSFSDLWKYNPADDSWEKIADFPVGSKHEVYAFVLGNSLYFGGGYGSDFQTRDSFFEYEF